LSAAAFSSLLQPSAAFSSLLPPSPALPIIICCGRRGLALLLEVPAS
jgi:hypothetical protein